MFVVNLIFCYNTKYPVDNLFGVETKLKKERGCIMKLKKQLGFTLVELLIVIAIIGILSTLAVVSVRYAQQQSRDAKRTSDISAIRAGLSLYYTVVGRYPDIGIATEIILGSADYNTLCMPTSGDAGFMNGTGGCIDTARTFMELVPANPTPNGSNYEYDVNSTGSAYNISFTLESAIGDLGAGLNCATAGGVTTTELLACAEL